MWDIWSFFFRLCPTFSFCWDICRFSFDYVPHFPFVGTYADFLSDYVPFLDFCGRFPRLFFAYVLLSDFCGRFPRLFFAYVLLSDFCGRFPRLFLHMSCFRISVGGSLAFFCICPTLGFLWEVSLPFFAYVPPFNTATKSLSDDTYLFINIPCI